MLIVDSKKRIEWDVLFTHPIVRYLDKILMKDIEDALTGEGDIALNASKLYLKANKVVDHPK